MEYFSSAWMWIGFAAFLVFALGIDTFVVGKYRSLAKQTWRGAIFGTFCWVASALVFNFLLWLYLYATTDASIANTYSLQFLTAYLIEESLSIDNLFVFYMIFQHFHISASHQQRVLSYGIWGAVIMRLGIILAGLWLIAKFHWLLYLMGAFLCFTGLKIMLMQEKEKDLSETLILKILRKMFRVTHAQANENFFIRKNNLLYATPLFITLIFIEISDLIFAVDSIPAVFAITREPFIVWSSNIFAILGLRAVYFLLAVMVEQLALLKYGIALILIGVGVKMLIEPWLAVSAIVTLGFIIVTLTTFSLISIRLTRKKGQQ